MKNLKKVLALVVVFSMMLCSVAFASFPDVNEDADYAVAVNTLAALGIVGGDDQGNFNPDNTITRAEFTKIVCEIQGLKGDANKGATAFTDVPADHWASGYINMATNLKIINGMGDGTFAPENPVTYEQAIKMLVVTLGYAPMAADKGGYPTGHLVVAQTYGMTKNVAAPAQAEAAKRSTIAQVVYNTIDTPMMEQTGFGSNVTYEVKDGTGDRERVTLLTSKFDVVKLGGVVVANEKIALEGEAAKGEIALKYDNNFKSTNEDFALEDKYDTEVLSNVEIGETNADDLFGLRVIAYVKDNGKSYEVIAIVPEEGKNASKEIALSDIDTGSRTITESDYEDYDDEKSKLKLAYFASEDASKSTQLTIDNAYQVIWNSVDADEYDLDYIVDAAYVEDEDDEVISAKVELVDWNNDNKYDLIKVNQYFHYVVDEVDAEDYTIEVLDSSVKFELNEEEVEYAISIENAAGEAMDFADIQAGDVIAVISDDVENVDEPESFIEITVLGQTGVEGTVRAYDDNGTLVKVKIGDAQYAVDAACVNAEKIGLGSEGTFYLGVDGQIVAFDGTKAASGNYGVIVKSAEVDSDWTDATWQIKVLNAEGKAVVYDVADKVTLKNNKKETAVTVELDDTIDADFFENTVFGEAEADYTLEALLGAFEDEAADNAGKIARMIQFKVNAANEIKEIAPAYDISEVVSAKYDVDDKEIGDVAIDASTVIFNVKAASVADGKIVPVDALLNEVNYVVAGFGYDDDAETFAAMMILGGGDTLSATVEGWAVVKAISEIRDEDDNEAYSLEVVEGGESEAKTIVITEDTVVDSEYNGAADALVLADNMAIGSIILYTADANGNVTTLASIANIVVEDGYEVYDFVIDIDAVYAEDSDYETTFVYGVIDAKADASPEISGTEIKVKSATKEYRYNNTNSRNKRIVVGSYNGGAVKDADDEDNETNIVFARLVNNKCVDVIAIEARVPQNILD